MFVGFAGLCGGIGSACMRLSAGGREVPARAAGHELTQARDLCRARAELRLSRTRVCERVCERLAVDRAGLRAQCQRDSDVLLVLWPSTCGIEEDGCALANGEERPPARHCCRTAGLYGIVQRLHRADGL